MEFPATVVKASRLAAGWIDLVTVDDHKSSPLIPTSFIVWTDKVCQLFDVSWCCFFLCIHLNYSNSPLNTWLMLSWEPTDMIMKYNEHDLRSLHDISLYHCHLSFDANNLPKQRPQTSYHHNGTNQTSHHLPILISTARRPTGWDGFQITK